MTPGYCFQRVVDEFVDECCKVASTDAEVAYTLEPHKLYAKVTMTTPLGDRTFLVRPKYLNPSLIYIDVDGKEFQANHLGLYQAFGMTRS